MRLFSRRRLTPGETALARGIFADSLDCRRVRLLQAPPLSFNAMVPFGATIVFSRWRAALDFAEAGVHEQGWLIHELCHVWQAQRGVTLTFAKLQAMGRRAYRPPQDRPFGAMNIEAQAEIARLAFLARRGACDDGFAALAARWPIRCEDRSKANAL
jgi:hypothetical protein